MPRSASLKVFCNVLCMLALFAAMHAAQSVQAQIVVHAEHAFVQAVPGVNEAVNAKPIMAAVLPRDAAHAQAMDELRQALRAALEKSKFANAANAANSLPTIAWSDAIEKQIKAGDATTLIEAAIELMAGEHVSRHLPLALKLAEQAAAMNDPRAIALLANAAANGWGQPRDLQRARALVLSLQEQGFARAFCMQAEWDARLPGGAEQRRVRAMLMQGAEQGDAVCLNAHAVQLEQEGHAEAAKAAYAKAAEQGHVIAQQNFERMERLMEETKLRRDATHLPSLRVVQTAADQGDAQAQFDLARRLHRGVQAPTDLAQAFYWYGQAAKSLPQAREVFGLIVSQSPALQQGEIDVHAMQTLSQLPAVKSVEMNSHHQRMQLAPRIQQPPLRDVSLLTGREKLVPQKKKLDATLTTATNTSTSVTAQGVISPILQ